MVGMGQDFKALDTQQVLLAYRRASRRAILLDWGGTLTPADSGFYDQRDATCFALPVNVLEALRKLCAHPSCHVMIMSGLPKDKARLCTSAAFAASAASARA